MACCQQVGKHVEDIGYKNSPIVLALLSNVCPSSRELIPRAKLYRKKHWKQQNFPKTSCRWHRKMQFRKKENLRLPEHYAYKFTGISFSLTQKLYMFKTPGHTENSLSFGVMNYTRTANLAGTFLHTQHI